MIKDQTSSFPKRRFKNQVVSWPPHGLAQYAVGVNHGGSYVTVTEQFLDRPDIIIGMQKMGVPLVAGWRKVWEVIRCQNGNRTGSIGIEQLTS